MNILFEYFQAEKTESLFFISIGFVGITAGISLWLSSSVYKNMLFPLIIIGSIQLIVGSSVYTRTDKQVETLIKMKEVNPIEFKNSEIERMKTVNKNFQYYKALEIFLIFLGIALSYFFQNRIGIYSIAIGLILESSLMLVLDLFAEKRAIDYFDFLLSFSS